MKSNKHGHFLKTVAIIALVGVLTIGLCACNNASTGGAGSTNEPAASTSPIPGGGLDRGDDASNNPQNGTNPNAGSANGSAVELVGAWSATGETQGASLEVGDNDVASFTYVTKDLATVSYDGTAAISDGKLVINDKLSGNTITFHYSMNGDILTLKSDSDTFTLKRK